jgi:hypothetical protein
MLTSTLSLPAQLVNDVQRHPDVAHEDLHGRLGVLVLEEQLAPVAPDGLGRLPDAVDQPRPRLGVRGLERVVVALDPGPDDVVGADLAGEVGCLDGQAHRLLAHGRVGRHEPAAAEARVEVQPGRQAVDAVAVERVADLVEVVARELVRVVELVVVDEVAETLDRTADLLRRGLLPVLGLVADGHEAGDHPAHRPDAEARLQVAGHGRFAFPFGSVTKLGSPRARRRGPRRRSGTARR